MKRTIIINVFLLVCISSIIGKGNASVFLVRSNLDSLPPIFSLHKYCYLIYGFSKDTMQATCFFIKKEKDYYLVTASHVVYGEGSDSISLPDRLNVLIAGHLIKMDIRKFKKVESKSFEPFLKPDVFTVKVPRKEIKPIRDKINYINQFIDESIIFDTITHVKKIVSFGYRSYGDESIYPYGAKVLMSMLSLRHPLNLRDFYERLNVLDTCNYSVNTDGSPLGPGYSGAPVFFRIGSGDSTKTIFAGLCSGGNIENGLAFIVRPYYVINALNEASKKKSARTR